MLTTALTLVLFNARQDSEIIDRSLQSLLTAIKAKDYATAQKFVKTDQREFKPSEVVGFFEKSIAEDGYVFESRITEIQKSSSWYTVSLSTRFGKPGTDPEPEELIAEVVDGTAKFVPKLSKSKPGPTAFWIVLLDNDSKGELSKIFTQAKSAAEKAAALSNGKQLCLGFLMYSADNDDNLPGADWKAAIKPYLKNNEVFSFKFEGKSYSFSSNPRLTKKNFMSIKRPAETVLIFVGSSDKLDFMFNGQTIVGFADGHVKAISREQAKSLIWKP